MKGKKDKARRSLTKTMTRKAEGMRSGTQGAALVETALSISVLLTVMVGIMQLCLVMYASIFVNEAAREATRYASIRGSNSCIDLASFPNCNLGPTGSSNPSSTTPSAVLQSYVQSLGYPLPNPNNITVTATWWMLTQTSTGNAQWTTPCTTLYENGPTGSPPGNGQACNQPQNMVTVQVNYSIPLYIPFWQNASVNLTSTSSMVIAN